VHQKLFENQRAIITPLSRSSDIQLAFRKKWFACYILHTKNLLKIKACSLYFISHRTWYRPIPIPNNTYT